MRISFWIKDFIYRTMIAISPKLLLEIQFKRLVGYKPDFDNPKTYNEKLGWYKLFYHDPLMTRCADKWEVRAYLEEIGLGEYMNDALGVWDRVEDIDFSKLPEKTDVQCSHLVPSVPSVSALRMSELLRTLSSVLVRCTA